SARSWSSSTIMMRMVFEVMAIASSGCSCNRGGRLNVGLSVLAGQPDGEGRAFVDRAFDVDRAAMLLDQLAHRRQAEADALRLGREQRLEDLAQLVRRNARAGVGYRQPDVRAGRDGTDGDHPLTLVTRRPF